MINNIIQFPATEFFLYFRKSSENKGFLMFWEGIDKHENSLVGFNRFD